MRLSGVCKSILKHTSVATHFCILTEKHETIPSIKLIMDTFTDESQYTVKALTQRDTEFLNSIYVAEARRDITGFGYSQLLIPDYFSEYKKMLFMEPDQIVRKDLASFWNDMWLLDVKLGAVDYNNGDKTMRTLHALYPEKPAKTYNAGVVVIDTEFWKSNECKELCIEACKEQKKANGGYYNYYAEGAMNVALQRFFYELDPKYYTCNLGWMTTLPNELLNNAFILHWNGTYKPWCTDGLYIDYYLGR
jgi:lipopolysaccharide biosynthesis glycosyltransferase